jgi:thiol-disulfide isomerase/thioredoxin
MTSIAESSPASRRAALLWLLLALVILVAGAAWVWASRVPADTLAALRAPAPAVNHPAPDFTAPLLTGENFSLSSAQGTPVVLNYWATWCGPCRAEMPAIQKAAENYGERVHFVAVNQGEKPNIIAPFVEEFGLTFPIALDPDQAVGGDLYNVKGMPTTFFIDAEGTVQRVWMGEMNAITLEEGIAEILN